MPTTPVPLCALYLLIGNKQRHTILASNLNVISRLCDILLIFKIVRNKNVSPENSLTVTIYEVWNRSQRYVTFVVFADLCRLSFRKSACMFPKDIDLFDSFFSECYNIGLNNGTSHKVKVKKTSFD